eukprot:scaffold47554_cov64-Attheya_sp.AAC.2
MGLVTSSPRPADSASWLAWPRLCHGCPSLSVVFYAQAEEPETKNRLKDGRRLRHVIPSKTAPDSLTLDYRTIKNYR